MSDKLKIFLTTDTHVGYLETDPIRGEDSFVTMREIVEMSSTSDVVLHSGDLFHHNKPSRETVVKTIDVLRPIGTNCVEVLDTKTGERVLPKLLAIHGNHDDPSGIENLSVLDLLHRSSVLHYFGKYECVDSIVVDPVVVRKGETIVALYGIGGIKDERLYRTFSNNQVQYNRCHEATLNILILHQNRHAHTPTSYIPEFFIENWFDIVIWGHEHECRIDPEDSGRQSFVIIQPGSSIATSLCEKESVEKYCATLTVEGSNYSVKKHVLRTVRKLIITELSLRTLVEREETNVDEQLVDYVRKLTCNYSLPLVRVKIECDEYPVPNTKRLAHRLEELVANPREVFLCTKKREKRREDQHKKALDSRHEINEIIKHSIQKNETTLLPEKGFVYAVESFITKSERNAFSTYLAESVSKAKELLSALPESDISIYYSQVRSKLNSEYHEVEPRRQSLEDSKEYRGKDRCDKEESSEYDTITLTNDKKSIKAAQKPTQRKKKTDISLLEDASIEEKRRCTKELHVLKKNKRDSSKPQESVSNHSTTRRKHNENNTQAQSKTNTEKIAKLPSRYNGIAKDETSEQEQRAAENKEESSEQTYYIDSVIFKEETSERKPANDLVSRERHDACNVEDDLDNITFSTTENSVSSKVAHNSTETPQCRTKLLESTIINRIEDEKSKIKDGHESESTIGDEDFLFLE